MSAKGSVIAVVFSLNLVLCAEDRVERKSNGSRILFPGSVEVEEQVNDTAVRGVTNAGAEPASPALSSREIPLELIRRLNTLSSVEEFFTDMIETEQPDLSDRMASGPFERGSARIGRPGKCTPEFTTVSLRPNQSATTFYYPRCARVKRCGGCCLHDLFSCRPTEKEVVPVPVAIAEYRGGHQFRLKERKIVEIEQHTKCECGCKVLPQDCTKYQRYSPENCRCECPNSEKEKKCHRKIWSQDICSCICRDELTCGTGFEFDFFTCSCVSSRGRRKSSFLYRVYV